MQTKHSEQEHDAQGFVGEEAHDELIDGRVWRKTLTANTCEFHPERAKTRGRLVVCGRLRGTVRGTEKVPADPRNPEGEKLIVLVGDFKGDSYNDDGEVFGYVGGWCALPLGQEVVLSRLQQMIDDGIENVALEIDLEFAATDRTKAPIGYSWLARNLMPVKRDTGIQGEEAAARRLARVREAGPSLLQAPKAPE